MLFATWRFNRLAELIAADLRSHLARLRETGGQTMERLSNDRFILGFLCIGVGIGQRNLCRYGLEASLQGKLLIKVMTELFAASAPTADMLEILLTNDPMDRSFTQGAQEAFKRIQFGLSRR